MVTLDLLEKIFQNLEMTLTQPEATAKAHLFLKCLKDNHISVGEDYWIQISKEWDLNVYDKHNMSLYPVTWSLGEAITNTACSTDI